MKVLYINSCVRNESRTARLAHRLLQKYGDYTEIDLSSEPISPLNSASLEKRTSMINKNDFSSNIFNYAKQFSEADVIVISAPFWDLSFPASLKIYLENIYVTGIVSKYNEDGKPKGLCQGKLLYYVTTAGGVFERKYSYDYISDLAINYFGIKEVKLISAEMLDVKGYDAEKIMNEALNKIDCIEI